MKVKLNVPPSIFPISEFYDNNNNNNNNNNYNNNRMMYEMDHI